MGSKQIPEDKRMFQSLYGAHIEEIQRRWESAMLEHDFAGVLVHAGTPRVSFLDDYVYSFRANPNFVAWLPLRDHHDSVLLIRPGQKPVLWFYQADDYWHSAPSDPESWWASHMDIRVVSDVDAWRTDLPAGANRLAAVGDSTALQAVFTQDQINPQGLLTSLHVARTCKTDYEIACMRKASEKAVLAHRAAAQAFRDGKSEYEIHLDYLHACQQVDEELPYNSIVALNDHAAVLHYQRRDRHSPQQSLSFLIDAGSTVNTYASDITRTYASQAGAFAELVSAMDEMQQGLAGMVRAGVDFKDLHLTTHLQTAQILKAADIITISPEDAVATGLSSVFYPHGLGHFIGLQTHDVAGLHDDQGSAIAPPEGHPFLRLTRVLEKGNVLTIEPGLYFIDSILSQWKSTGDAGAINWDTVSRLSPFGGIRIEDNVVVGETGCENLTRRAFAEA
jgi:Xaa-Pro dipeptidase